MPGPFSRGRHEIADLCNVLVSFCALQLYQGVYVFYISKVHNNRLLLQHIGYQERRTEEHDQCLYRRGDVDVAKVAVMAINFLAAAHLLGILMEACSDMDSDFTLSEAFLTWRNAKDGPLSVKQIRTRMVEERVRRDEEEKRKRLEEEERRRREAEHRQRIEEEAQRQKQMEEERRQWEEQQLLREQRQREDAQRRKEEMAQQQMAAAEKRLADERQHHYEASRYNDLEQQRRDERRDEYDRAQENPVMPSADSSSTSGAIGTSVSDSRARFMKKSALGRLKSHGTGTRQSDMQGHSASDDPIHNPAAFPSSSRASQSQLPAGHQRTASGSATKHATGQDIPSPSRTSAPQSDPYATVPVGDLYQGGGANSERTAGDRAEVMGSDNPPASSIMQSSKFVQGHDVHHSRNPLSQSPAMQSAATDTLLTNSFPQVTPPAGMATRSFPGMSPGAYPEPSQLDNILPQQAPPAHPPQHGPPADPSKPYSSRASHMAAAAPSSEEPVEHGRGAVSQPPNPLAGRDVSQDRQSSGLPRQNPPAASGFSRDRGAHLVDRNEQTFLVEQQSKAAMDHDQERIEDARDEAAEMKHKSDMIVSQFEQLYDTDEETTAGKASPQPDHHTTVDEDAHQSTANIASKPTYPAHQGMRQALGEPASPSAPISKSDPLDEAVAGKAELSGRPVPRTAKHNADKLLDVSPQAQGLSAASGSSAPSSKSSQAANAYQKPPPSQTSSPSPVTAPTARSSAPRLAANFSLRRAEKAGDGSNKASASSRPLPATSPSPSTDVSGRSAAAASGQQGLSRERSPDDSAGKTETVAPESSQVGAQLKAREQIAGVQANVSSSRDSVKHSSLDSEDDDFELLNASISGPPAFSKSTSHDSQASSSSQAGQGGTGVKCKWRHCKYELADDELDSKVCPVCDHEL